MFRVLIMLCAVAEFSRLCIAGKQGTGSLTFTTPQRAAFVTIATNDYYARGALVALHSVALNLPTGAADLILMVAAPGISGTWKQRFKAIGARIVNVLTVLPGLEAAKAMAADRANLAREGILELLQPVSYGGAFAKVHAWNETLFGDYDKVVLMDGDVVAKRRVDGLLEMEPISASRDLTDAFNYGVIVLKPSNAIHKALLSLLASTSSSDMLQYNTRKANEAGFCDQTLVSAYLAKHHGPVHMFEDLRAVSRRDPDDWLLSTEYNFVVSYRAKERCESHKERQRVDKARIVHFANHWLHFEALAKKRNAPGRIDSPRCYRGAFQYWHDVHAHALAVARANTSRRKSKKIPDPPVYMPTDRISAALMDEVESAQVESIFQDFQRQLAERSHSSESDDDDEL